MGVIDGIRRFLRGAQAYERVEDGRILDVPSGYNVRELGGYETAAGCVARHRYLRSGGTDRLVKSDIDYLVSYGVTHVLDLRGEFESPRRTCRLANVEGITWYNVELYGFDISDPALGKARRDSGENYLVDSYLTMLANREAIRAIMRFFIRANEGGLTCTLFHCAAGMDRTGVTAMLLLGLAGASRPTIVADYTYSFGDVAAVDEAIAARTARMSDSELHSELQGRMSAIETTYDTLLTAYGSVRDFLIACDLSAAELDTIVSTMVEPA